MTTQSRITSICLLAMTLMAATVVNAQDDAPKGPCELPEMRQFDFWIGEWDLTWDDTSKGLNIITAELDNCVIEENFKTLGEQPFVGHSVSTYNKRKGKWQQTWVDNSGAYLDFVGEFAGGKMTLSRTAVDTSGNEFLQRMVWHNIKENALDWKWEKSTDDGTTWQTLWAIRYERKK